MIKGKFISRVFVPAKAGKVKKWSVVNKIVMQFFYRSTNFFDFFLSPIKNPASMREFYSVF
jgi:hypothetical protein